MFDNIFNFSFSVFPVIFIVISCIAAAIFIFVIAMLVSPKLRGKVLSSQVKSVKYMVDDSKDDIAHISTNMADATREGVKTTARAVREGLVGETVYCKHCGSVIDADSTFCKHCGKGQ